MASVLRPPPSTPVLACTRRQAVSPLTPAPGPTCSIRNQALRPLAPGHPGGSSRGPAPAPALSRAWGFSAARLAPSYLALHPVGARRRGLLCVMASEARAEEGGDLLVVGPGVLGTLVAQQWMQKYPGHEVWGQTRTESRHGELRELGIQPAIGPPSVPGSDPEERRLFPYVIFCAPPYGNDDYAGVVRAATESWDKAGSFIFTSSSAVYAVSDNGPCNEEDCPTFALGQNPRADVLLRAEAEVLRAGGNVVRLAGLYTKERGAHTFWLRKGSVEARPDHILNLIHYEDAASLCVVILSARSQGGVFMGCDNHPLSRQEVVDIALRSGQVEGSFSGFTVEVGPLGKRMNNTKTREDLGWEPKYPSFEEFLCAAARI